MTWFRKGADPVLCVQLFVNVCNISLRELALAGKHVRTCHLVFPTRTGSNAGKLRVNTFERSAQDDNQNHAESDRQIELIK